MWATWTQRLGRPSDEFWYLTPREVFACIDVWREDQRLQNYRAGLSAAAVYNVNRRKSTTMIQPLEFFGEKKGRGRTAAEIGAMMENLLHRAKRGRA